MSKPLLLYVIKYKERFQISLSLFRELIIFNKNGRCKIDAMQIKKKKTLYKKNQSIGNIYECRDIIY